MIRVGLTGSIGMGKSTTAKMFEDAGVPVYDSDAAVHALYETSLVEPIEARFPGVTKDGHVDRQRLSSAVLGKPEEMKALEAIVHPAVHQAKETFLQKARRSGEPVVILDIPLLFETGGEDHVDKVVVVSAPADVQRERVLARPEMTSEKFEAILARQMPDAEKRARADFVIDTSKGMESAKTEVDKILEKLC